MTRSPNPASERTILAPWHSELPASSTLKPTSSSTPTLASSRSKTSAPTSTSPSTSPPSSPAPSTSASNGRPTASSLHPPKRPRSSPNSPPSASSSSNSPSRRPPTDSATSSPLPPTSPSPSANSSPRRRRLATLIVAVLVGLATNATVALAHTRAEVDELITELHGELIYRIEYVYHSGINPSLLQWFRTELEAIEALYTPPPTRTPTSRSYTIGEAAAAWRPLVAAYFPAYLVEEALAVVWCESRGRPSIVNPSSGASGLFQHLARYWSSRSSKAGYGGANILDPTANVAVAAWLARTSLEAGLSPWAHWTCRP